MEPLPLLGFRPVSDDLIIGLVEQRVTRADCRHGFLFDGFPVRFLRPTPRGMNLLKVAGRLLTLLVSLDRIGDQLSRLGGITPADQFDPFTRLKILVVFEEVLDLFTCDLR